MRRSAPEIALTRGSVVWTNLDPVLGREQSGHRPALIVSSDMYLETVTTLVTVVPITTVDRGWPNHVALEQGGLDRPSWAMVEQPRTIARTRITSVIGLVSRSTMDRVDTYLRDFLGL